MDSERAREIMESKGVIEVLYQGSPVWIENVMKDNIVEIIDIETNDKHDVPANMLVEKVLQK